MPLSSFPSQPFGSNAAKPLESSISPEIPGFNDAVRALGLLITAAGLAIADGITDLFDGDNEKDKDTQTFPLIPGGQPEIQIDPGSPGTPTGYNGGSSASQQWYRVFQRAFVQNGEFDSWLAPTYQDAGIGTRYASQLLVDGVADEDFTHFSFQNSPLSEEPSIGASNKQYKIRESQDGGAPIDVLLGNFFGCRFLGYSGTNGVLPDTNDPVYYQGTEQDPITTAHDAGKDVLPAPVDLGDDAELTDDLLKFLIEQSDKIIQQNEIVIFNQKQQTEILGDLLGDLADRLEVFGSDLLDSLGAQDTEVLPSPDIEELPVIGNPIELPALDPVPITPSEPLALPDAGEALKMPGLDEYIDFVPPDPRDGEWTPKVLPVPLGDIGKVLADIQQCVCVEAEDCCAEILQKLQEIDGDIEELREVADDIQWEVDPPLPGSGDLNQGSISATTGGTFTGLGRLVWVKMTMAVAPVGRVKITFANNSGPNVHYVGWMSWNIDGAWTEKQIMTWESAMYPAPKGSSGFAFTSTHGAQYSAEYWTDARTTA